MGEAAGAVNDWRDIFFLGVDHSPCPALIKHFFTFRAMKIASSLKSLKSRHPDCQVVRRKGRIYVINKTNPRFKARQG